jgi:hypothetical protein
MNKEALLIMIYTIQTNVKIRPKKIELSRISYYQL